MRIPKRWIFWGSGLFLGVIVLVTWYASQPIAGETASASQVPPSSSGSPAIKTPPSAVAPHATTADEVPSAAQKRGQDGSPDIAVSEEEIDRVIDEALTFLERLAEKGTDAAEGEAVGENSVGQNGDAAEGEGGLMPEEETLEAELDAGEAPEPEQIMEEFITALQSLDLDTLASMARGQARDKIEELRAEMGNAPPEAMMMLQSIQPVNGRRVSDDEFRFNLQVPGDANSPEIVLRYDGGQWWIDEIID